MVEALAYWKWGRKNLGLGEKYVKFLPNNFEVKEFEAHLSKESKWLGTNLMGGLGFAKSKSVVVIIEYDSWNCDKWMR